MIAVIRRHGLGCQVGREKSPLTVPQRLARIGPSGDEQT